jgi:hypothetical protein
MNPLTIGFTEKSYRPWPDGADFLIMDMTEKFLDLCYRREDGVIVYLASKKK